MDPERVRAYLQVACAGLGFDIGEVWWTSNENGSSTVAAIEEPKQQGEGGAMVVANSKPRFVQLYTSKMFESRRAELVNPPDQKKGYHRGESSENLEKHVLSPRLVDAISKTAQVVWATTKKQEGLIGRSDIRLQTAVGMPVAVDANGNMCIVVMFSPNNIQSTDDAMEYLQAISESATSSSIPCLLPVFDERLGYHHGLVRHAPHPGASSLGEGVTARFVSLDDAHHNHHNNFPRSLPLALCDQPEIHSDHELSTAPKDVFGIPMLPSFAELGGQVTPDDGDKDAFDDATHGIWTTIMDSLNGEDFFDMQPENEVALVSDNEQTMEQALRVDWSDKAPMTDCRKLRLEEFCTAFLGMSVFDLADVWVPAGDEYPDSLRHVMAITSTDTNPVLNHFGTVSESTLIKCWAGAVGTAFSSGNPVWSANPKIFADPGRYDAFQMANFQTVLAVPVFSNKQVMPACVVSCYSFVRSTSVPFVLRFVQQALRLLWEGLDKVTPHDSVGGAWKNVAPADLGEMAADMEMHEHFIKKKRTHDLISVEPSKPDPLTNQISSQFQAIELPNGDTVSLPLQIAEITDGHVPQNPPEIKVQTLQNHIYEAVRSVADAIPFDHVNTNSDGSKRAHIMMVGPAPSGPPVFRPLAMPQPLPTKIVGSSSPSFHQAERGVYQAAGGLQQPHVTVVPIVFAAPVVQQQQQQQHPAPIAPSSPPFQTQLYQTQNAAAPLFESNGVAAFHLPSNTNVSAPNPVASSMPVQFCVPVTANQQQHVVEAATLKPCRIQGCSEPSLSRRPYCERHSGNRSCEHPGCNKCAQGSTRFCIAHGGGRRCTFPGCDKGARDKLYCAAHGGGKRCKQDGCNKSAVGGSSLCTAHGGGKRCSVQGCDKSAQSSTQFCVKHGGGKKCLHQGCEKVARGRTMYCAAHGGGVRCKLDGCNRVAIGKLQLCRAHGGGSLARSGDDSPEPYQTAAVQQQQLQPQQLEMSFHHQPPLQQMQPSMIGVPTGQMTSVLNSTV